ncbi:MAG TPA: MFS transporter [Gemmatimonadaceae bacterium]
MNASAGRARRQLSLLSLAIVLGMSPWFAATVVATPMADTLGLSPLLVSWLTLAVQLGFVFGSLGSAVLVLSDRLSPRRLAAGASFVAAGSTALLALVQTGAGAEAIGLRLLTGAALACVYPPGIKIAAGWTDRHRGTAIGILVGAVTLGTATPHLLRAAVDLGFWRPVLLAAAASAALGGVLFLVAVREGPYQAPSAPFDPGAVRRVLRDRGVRLATAGYLGHMWELYAMWSTVGLFLTAAASRHGVAPVWAPIIAFAAIGVGAIGSVVAGIRADRVGRVRVAIAAMAVSGTCAVLVGPTFRVSFPLTVLVTLIWGVSVVADSAQFSACVAELSPREYVGTAVTVQTAAGFLLTMLTIHLVPGWATRWGWEWAYLPLVAGPVFGIVAMQRLGPYRSPDGVSAA